MLENAVLYARIILLALPFNVLQLLFQSFCVTAEKPRLGLTVTVMSGVTNMVMDAVLVMLLPQEYKLAVAAAATALSETVGGLVPLIYFGRENDSILRLGRCSFDGKAILKACTNGSSEFMSNVSMSLVGMLYNIQLIKYAGEDGVAAYGVMMYVSMIFSAAFVGYSIGTAPIVGYHDGAKNYTELKALLRKSLIIIGAFAVAMVAAAELLAAEGIHISVINVHRLRRGADENDGVGLPHFCAVLPVHGLRHIWLRLLHGAERRADLGADILFEDAGVPGGRGAAPAGAMGAGRRVDIHRRGGVHGCGVFRDFPHRQAEEVSLLSRGQGNGALLAHTAGR